MSLTKQKILTIGITENSMEEVLEEMQKYLSEKVISERKLPKNSEKTITIVTVNSEQAVYARTDKHFAQLLNKADVALPDGAGIVWASRTLSTKPLQRRIAGVEFMEMLVTVCAKEGFPIGLIGGRGHVAVRTLECLQKKHKNITGWAEDGPELQITNDTLHMSNNAENTEEFFIDLARKINQNQTRVVFVGLGAPKQEYFTEELRSSIVGLGKKHAENSFAKTQYPGSNLPLIIMSVGGSFDIIAGKLPRAPIFFRTIGLEWLWRLIREPWRAKRQLSLLTFVRLVIQSRLSL